MNSFSSNNPQYKHSKTYDLGSNELNINSKSDYIISNGEINFCNNFAFELEVRFIIGQNLPHC